MSGDHSGPQASLAAQVRHLESLLEQHGLVDAGSLDSDLAAYLTKASPDNGARLAARAWLDESFRNRLLADANAALPELGLSMGGGLAEQRLKVVANSEQEHNVIVCTLCSCYPIALLGPSPTWYKSEAYRSRVVRDPRGVLREFGYELPIRGQHQRLGRERGVQVHGAAKPAGRAPRASMSRHSPRSSPVTA